jgi:hypothetical protein
MVDYEGTIVWERDWAGSVVESTDIAGRRTLYEYKDSKLVWQGYPNERVVFYMMRRDG